VQSELAALRKALDKDEQELAEDKETFASKDAEIADLKKQARPRRST